MQLVEEKNIQNEQNNQIKTITTNQNLFQGSYHKNFAIIRFLLKVSIFIFVGRVSVFVFTFIYNNIFFITDTDGKLIGWDLIVYFMAVSIDLINVFAILNLLKFLASQSTVLEQLNNIYKQNISVAIEDQPVLKGAPYFTYLSIYDTIRFYKWKNHQFSSIFKISRYMHIILTFCTFGSMALYSQQQYNVNWYKILLLWIFLLSIYIDHFQLDFYHVQNSSGSYKHLMQNFNTSQNMIKLRNKNTYYIVQKSYLKPIILLIFISAIMIIIYLILYWSMLIWFSKILCTILTVFQLIFIIFMIYSIYQMHHNLSFQLKQYTMMPTINCVMFIFLGKYRKLYCFLSSLNRICTFLLFLHLISEPIELQSLLIYCGLFFLILSQFLKFQWADKLKLLQLFTEVWKAEDQNSQSQCTICLLKFSQKENIIVLPCCEQHIFHQSCLYSWIQSKSQCPLCRYNLIDYI